MPALQVRSVRFADVASLVAIDHNFSTEYVWQMEVHERDSQVGVTFYERRLPRAVRVGYPRPSQYLADVWDSSPGLLVAELTNGEPVGYVRLADLPLLNAAHATDLAVSVDRRRQGIATALLLAAGEWARHHGRGQLTLEMQAKNHAAINLARKLGFEFCGYRDRYYPNQDIALFFCKFV